MRRKTNRQCEFDFPPSNLQLTNEYYEKYEAVSTILDASSRILDLVHRDLKETLEAENARSGDGGNFEYTSDTVLRVLVCQIIEGLSLRGIVIRVDDSHYLRRFVRIYHRPMMDYTTFCKLKNCIRPETWKKVNEVLRSRKR